MSRTDRPAPEPLSLDRRTLMRLASGGAVATGALAAGAVGAPVASAAPTGGASSTPVPARQFRALWIASVENIDWPSRTGLSAAKQKAEFVKLCELARSLNMNAVISQVRPSADAFWPSPYEPWSQYLTGTQGKDPGYDPLRFQVETAHAHNLEYHAWFNPYRISNRADPKRLVPEHPARRHPEWVRSYGGKLYYDPGMPEVRRFVEDAMMHAVRHADIDAVHFDDYFYPYPVEGEEFPDETTFQRYGRGESLADWRRSNVNTMVAEMHERIHRAKPWVKFGISPFGVWRNESSDPRGSATKASEGYEIISCDPLAWIEAGSVDYLCPQIYWEIGHELADYAVLAPWWADAVADSDVELYIGQAAYKATEKTGGFADPKELERHLELNAKHPEIGGDAYFSATDMAGGANGAVDIIRRTSYAHPAIVPTIRHLGGRAPAAPVGLTVKRHGKDLLVRWRRPRSFDAVSYGIWALPGGRASEAAFADGRNLLATVRADECAVTQQLRVPATGHPITVVAYDRLFHASRAPKPTSAR